MRDGRGEGAELRARGIAALLCGERPAVIARDLSVPQGTVRSWKHRAKGNFATLKKGNFGTLLTEHLEILVGSLIVQSRELSTRWHEMKAGELALVFGVLFDRSLRMMDLYENSGGRGEGKS